MARVRWRRPTGCGLGQGCADSADSEGAASSVYCMKALKAQSSQALGLEEQFGILLGTACYTLDTEASSIASQQDDLDNLKKMEGKKHLLYATWYLLTR